MNEKFCTLIRISLKFVPKALINVGIGSDNGLAPGGWQAIVWTNDAQFINAYMRHSASMS